MGHYKYLLWDMDGTIVNTYEGVSKATQHAFDHFGIRLSGDEYYKYIGPPLRESFPKYAGIPLDQVEYAVQLFREYYNTTGVWECELFPDVRETLKAFRDAGYVQALASSKPENMCLSILGKFGLTDLFDLVAGASPDGKVDSKIEVLRDAFRRLKELYPDFKKEDAVLIGDTKYDADGANEAGIDCIGVSYGFGSRQELKQRGVVQVYDNLAKLRGDLM